MTEILALVGILALLVSFAMMAEAIQIRADINNEPFVLDGSAEVVDGITLAASQGAITRGAVLGEVSATPGTYKVVNRAAQDGTNLPKLILATKDVVDSASTTTNLAAYNEGMFDENQLAFAGDTNLDSRLDGELMPNQTDRDFSTPAWANVDINAYNETDDLTITATAAAQYCTLAVASFPTVIGNHYTMSFDVANIVESWTIQDFTGAQDIGVINANATQGTLSWTATTTGGLRIVADATTSSGDFDNFTLVLASQPNTELMPNQVDQDFSTPAWTNVDINAYDETDDLTITSTVAGQYCTLPVASAPTEIGKTYTLKYDLANLAQTGWTVKDFTGTQTIGTMAANVTQGAITWTAETAGGFRLISVHNDSSADIDNLSIILVGEDTDHSMRDLMASQGLRLAPGISVSKYQNPIV